MDGSSSLAEHGVLGDEAEVAEVGGVEAAEGHVLQAVEVVLRRGAVVAATILQWFMCQVVHMALILLGQHCELPELSVFKDSQHTGNLYFFKVL